MSTVISPVRSTPHAAAFETGAAARLDKGRKADADQLAAFAPVVALAQKIFVVGHLERFAQRFFEIAGIVLDAGARGVGELIGLNEILSANFQAVHAQNRRGLVEQALDVQDRLGPAGAAIGAGRTSVGKDGDDLDPAVLNLIAAAGHAEHALRRSGGAGVQIGAEIGDDFDFQTENLAVFSERHLRRHRLVASLDRRDEIFAAGGDPFDRLAQFEREIAGDDIFAVHRSLAAEAAADVRRDQMNFVFRKAEGVGDLGARAMRALGGEPHGQALAEGIGIDGDAARFHGQRDLARAGDVHGENMIGRGEGFVDVAAVLGHGVADVAVELFVRQGRTGL